MGALPGLGPVISPSRYGIKYASGVFQFGRTVMHVSRGLAGDDPIRWNCPPELSLITLATERAEASPSNRTRFRSGG